MLFGGVMQCLKIGGNGRIPDAIFSGLMFYAGSGVVRRILIRVAFEGGGMSFTDCSTHV